MMTGFSGRRIYEDKYKRPHVRGRRGAKVIKNYQEVRTSSDGRLSVAFANDNDCRRYTTLLKRDHISLIFKKNCFGTLASTLTPTLNCELLWQNVTRTNI